MSTLKTTTLAILLFLAETTISSDMDLILRMASDFQSALNLDHRATLIASVDFCAPCSESLLLPGSLINMYSLNETLGALEALKAVDQLHYLVATSSGDLRQFLSACDQGLGLFKAKTATLIPKQADWSYLKLRLDSQLYFYDTVGSIIYLYEVYAIKSGPQMVRQIGQWSSDIGLKIPELNLWQRRSDLMGTTIINGVMTWSMFNKVTADSSGNILSVAGIFAETMSKLSKKLNFTEKPMMPPDRKWGGREADGTWNGIIKMLMDKRFDMSTGGLTQFKERDAVVDFTIPMGKEGSTLIAKKTKGVTTQFWVYLEIFPVHTWVIINAFVIAFGIAFLVISISGMNRFHSPDDSEAFSLLNSLAVSGLLVLQLGYNVILNSPSAKMLFMFDCFMSYLIYTYYTCDLTARMTSGPPALTVRFVIVHNKIIVVDNARP